MLVKYRGSRQTPRDPDLCSWGTFQHATAYLPYRSMHGDVGNPAQRQPIETGASGSAERVRNGS